jgi:hypothetical protein
LEERVGTTLDWTWKINLETIVERQVFLETIDGVRREGRISGLRVQTIRATDKGVTRNVNIPTALELNGDAFDLIEFSRILHFELK